MKTRLVMLGPPGAGKGTQAQRLAVHLGFPQISTGDILREELRQGSELGRRAGAFMNQGHLVPDDLVLEIVGIRLDQPDCAGGFLFDGFPRTLAQAGSLDRMLTERETPLTAVVSIEVPDEEILGRLAGRRVCGACGMVFNLVSKPPARADHCDCCGGELKIRDDDHPDTVRHRLEVYRRQTEPLIDYYHRQGLILPVPGLGSMDEVFARIGKALAGTATP